MAHILTKLNPWLASPIIVSAPMLGAATPTLAANVTKAGGLGFLPGVTKGNTLEISLRQAAELTQTTFLQAKVKKGIIPVGVGFQLWNCQLDVATKVFGKHTPAVAWLFAPKESAEFANWARGVRKATERRTQIWVQVATVAEARAAVEMAEPDVIVVQGSDAGGHGLARSASVMALVPEVLDLLESLGRSNVPVLAAGGITEGRGVAGALALGASGVVMGTRFLAATEAGIPQGWKNEITRLADGGASTTRSTLCDRLKETKGWPAWYDGRAAVNRGHEDEEAGMCDEDNVARYKEEAAKGDESWGPHGRMVTYAGTGVGMIRDVKAAADIVEEVRAQSRIVLQRTSAEYAWPRAGPRL